MAANSTVDFVPELLKQIQAKLDGHTALLKDLHEVQIAIREDIHKLEGGQLRLERMNAEVQNRLERIERRLGLIEA